MSPTAEELWLRNLEEWPRKYSAAAQRLREILNRTGQTDDGETAFVALKDAAEVYAIMFHVITDPEMLADLAPGALVHGARVLRVKEQTDEETRYETLRLEGSIHIGIDMY